VSRGVVYLVWGDKAEAALKRSIFSLKEFHPELDCEVRRLPPDSSPSKGLLEKSSMMDFSPFDETLFLDADTILLDRLDFGFAQALRFGVACCIRESPWSRRYRGLPKDDDVEYNTGVLFFTRDAATLFARCRLCQAWSTRRSILWARTANRWSCRLTIRVVSRSRTPFILPMNWNFRPAWHRTFLDRSRSGTITATHRRRLGN
jgi:hypothetical protein